MNDEPLNSESLMAETGPNAPTLRTADEQSPELVTKLNPTGDAALRRRTRLLGLGCVATLLPCLLLWHSNHTLSAELENRRTRAIQLADDARTVASLQRQPRQASETSILHSDLLDRVHRALQTAGLPTDRLVSTLPQPPRSRPGAEHAEVIHRLMFENVTLEQLTRFCQALLQANSDLHLATLQLRAGSAPQSWNAEIGVAYWIMNLKASSDKSR